MFSPQLALLLCSAGAPSTTALPPIAIVGANVIRPAGEGVIRNATVVMRAGRFEAVGPRDRTPIPSGAHVIDGAGKWIIPGLIDMHVHLDEVLTPGAFTLFGVTTVRDVGSGRETIDALRKRAADGEPVPRICWMGRNIDEGRPSWWGAVAVKGPAEVPRLISDMQAQGVSGVKLYVFARTDVTRAVIAEAHKRGLPVTAHLGLTTPSEAARAGIDNIEHVTTLFHELRDRQKHIRPGYFDAFAGASQVSLGGARARRLLAILAHHHVAVTATLCAGLLPVEGESGAAAVYHGWADVPDGWRRYWRMPYWDFISAKGWTRAELRAARAANLKFQRFTKLLARSHVVILAGTDTPAPWVLPGAGLLAELEILRRSGLSANECLRGATSNAAGILHRSGDLGAVRPGYRADCVLLEANPLHDIRNLRRICAVYRDGRRVDRAQLWHDFCNARPDDVKLGK